MKKKNKSRKSSKKWSLVGIKRQLAYCMLAEGIPDAEVCEKLKINPANLAKAKTPYFLKRVELMRIGAKVIAEYREAESRGLDVWVKLGTDMEANVTDSNKTVTMANELIKSPLFRQGFTAGAFGSPTRR